VTGSRYTALTVDPGTGRLFLGTDDGLFRSGDGGRTWLHVSSVPATLVSGVVVDATTRSIVAGTAFGLFALDFSYASAEQRSARDTGTNIFRVARDPKDGQRVFASTQDGLGGAAWEGRLFRSRDGGTTWELLPQSTPDARHFIAVDAAGDLYTAARGDSFLQRLRRDANEFEVLPHEFGTSAIQDILADPTRPGWVYVLALSGSWFSRDAGATWERWAFPSSSVIDVAPTNANVVVGSTYDMLIWTSDGLNWHSTEIEGQRPNPVAIAPSDPATVYFVMEGGSEGRPAHTVGRSRNGGRTWTRMSAPDTGSDTVTIVALAVDPNDANRVWAATNAGMFLSTDGAVSWTSANAGLPTRATHSLAIDLQRGTVYVGTDQGVWSRAKAGRRRAVR